MSALLIKRATNQISCQKRMVMVPCGMDFLYPQLHYFNCCKNMAWACGGTWGGLGEEGWLRHTVWARLKIVAWMS